MLLGLAPTEGARPRHLQGGPTGRDSVALVLPTEDELGDAPGNRIADGYNDSRHPDDVPSARISPENEGHCGHVLNGRSRAV